MTIIRVIKHFSLSCSFVSLFLGTFGFAFVLQGMISSTPQHTSRTITQMHTYQIGTISNKQGHCGHLCEYECVQVQLNVHFHCVMPEYPVKWHFECSMFCTDSERTIKNRTHTYTHTMKRSLSIRISELNAAFWDSRERERESF